MPDFLPVVKLFLPAGGATWLLTELYEEEQDIAFGLCDLGMGFPELGYVSITELEEIRAPIRVSKPDGTPVATGHCMVERDLYFRPTKTLSQYAEEARMEGRIVA